MEGNKRKEKKGKKRHRSSRRRSRSRSRESDKERKPVSEKKHPKNASSEASAPGPTAKGGDEKSLSIEETNKLRAMLGLKPLQVPAPATSDGGQTSAAAVKPTGSSEIFVQTRNMGHDKEAEKIREKLELVREKRRVAQKVSGNLIGDDESVDDISSWVQRSRELASQREKLLAEADELATAELEEKPEYSSRHLTGIRVEHSFDRIKDERSVILTLKDKAVLDEDEGDVLENVNLADDERAEQNIANKKASQQVSGYGIVRYQPYDEEGGGEGTSLLNKYDEDIYGRKKQYFVLSGSQHDDDERGTKSVHPYNSKDSEAEMKPESGPGTSSNGTAVKPEMDVDMNPLDELRAKLKTVHRPSTSLRPAVMATSSLNSSGPVLASEYYTPEEMATKFKKVRKVRKPIRTLKADDLLEMDKEAAEALASTSAPMEEDAKPNAKDVLPTAKLEPVDAELEATIKKSKKIASEGAGVSRRLPEHVAVDLLAQTTLNPTAPAPAVTSDGSGWVMMNETSEFCRGIGDLPAVSVPEIDKSNGAGNVDMSSSEEEKDREEFQRRKSSGRNYRKKNESEDEDGTRRPKKQVSAPKKSENKKESEETSSSSSSESEDEFVLGYEPKAASSVAEALRLASMKGYLEKPKDASGGGTMVVAGKVSQLAAQNFHVEERSYGDIDAKFSSGRRGGGRDRLSGPVVDFCEKDRYNPDVKLEYINESGKIVNQKEAFRLLSHRFHGKGSGKRKVEKRLRKEAQERRVQTQASGDTPLHMLQRLQMRQQKEKQAHVVLSSSGTSTSATIAMPAANESPAKSKPKTK